MEAFWCACLLLPKGVIRTIEKACRQFLWGSESQCRMIFFSWKKKVCRKRSQGGFDIREILSWNKTLLLRFFLKYYTHSPSLWIAWSKEYVFKNLSCWDLDADTCISPIWQKILHIRDEFADRVGSRAAAQALFLSWSASGVLPLQDVYKIFHGFHPELRWVKPLLDNIVVPKHAVIATLAAHQALATVDNLCKRGLVLVNRCSLCCADAESVRHLFFQCPFSRDLLQQVLVWQGVTRGVLSLKHELYKLALCRGTKWRRKVACCALAATIYYIWQERNRRVFDGGHLGVGKLLAMIKYDVCVRMYSCSNGVVVSQLLSM
ncbi:uncharacterized protein LOC141642529 [Silene latifolia]|uniref:uncharacterized protein LOC141642529 n=1 Tax=Silene latifolia TaxID=37657 RepID=UPI003D779CFA